MDNAIGVLHVAPPLIGLDAGTCHLQEVGSLAESSTLICRFFGNWIPDPFPDSWGTAASTGEAWQKNVVPTPARELRNGLF